MGGDVENEEIAREWSKGDEEVGEKEKKLLGSSEEVERGSEGAVGDRERGAEMKEEGEEEKEEDEKVEEERRSRWYSGTWRASSISWVLFLLSMFFLMSSIVFFGASGFEERREKTFSTKTRAKKN